MYATPFVFVRWHPSNFVYYRLMTKLILRFQTSSAGGLMPYTVAKLILSLSHVSARGKLPNQVQFHPHGVCTTT